MSMDFGNKLKLALLYKAMFDYLHPAASVVQFRLQSSPDVPQLQSIDEFGFIKSILAQHKLCKWLGYKMILVNERYLMILD